MERNGLQARLQGQVAGNFSHYKVTQVLQKGRVGKEWGRLQNRDQKSPSPFIKVHFVT